MITQFLLYAVSAPGSCLHMLRCLLRVDDQGKVNKVVEARALLELERPLTRARPAEELGPLAQTRRVRHHGGRIATFHSGRGQTLDQPGPSMHH